jgi:hypothetical protein
MGDRNAKGISTIERAKQMSENTVVENTVAENTVGRDVETDSPVDTVNVETEGNAVETETVENEPTPEEIAKQALANLDEDSPLKPMILASRTILSMSAEKISEMVQQVKSGKDDVEDKISDIITDSEDAEIVAAVENIEALQTALDEATAELRSKVAAENDLTPMSDEDEAKLRDEIAKARKNYNSSQSATVKMLANMLPSMKDAEAFFADLASPASLSGATGTGVKKPRLKSATVNGTEITSGSGNEFPSFGDIAEYIAKDAKLTAPGNRPKPSEISSIALDEGLDSGTATFTFRPTGSSKDYTIHAVTR